MERFDCFYGTVTGMNLYGIFITSENGECTFAYGGNIPMGSLVLCTVLKEASEKRYPKVSIDSVIRYGVIAA